MKQSRKAWGGWVVGLALMLLAACSGQAPIVTTQFPPASPAGPDTTATPEIPPTIAPETTSEPAILEINGQGLTGEYIGGLLRVIPGWGTGEIIIHQTEAGVVKAVLNLAGQESQEFTLQAGINNG